ncbi:hypothetical protein FXO38_06363 [Capsicum annuum]|nr:hypothetical protein FXO37_32525 [Capsicum annuum]KAF3671918.1 hypothetical protein FXO38_06363 [Capsicum annuum]
MLSDYLLLQCDLTIKPLSYALSDNEKLVDGETALVVEAEEVDAGNVREKPVPEVVEEAPVVATTVVEMLGVVVEVENKGDEPNENPALAGVDTGALEEEAEAVTELSDAFATENDRPVEGENSDGDEEAVAGMEKEIAGAGAGAGAVELGVDNENAEPDAAELGVDNENVGADAAKLEVENENDGVDAAELADAVVSENPGADTEEVVEELNNENAGAEEAELAGEAPGKENVDEEENELAGAELANENEDEEEAELDAEIEEAVDDGKANGEAVDNPPKGEDEEAEEDPNTDEENGFVLALVAAVPVDAAPVDDEKDEEEPNKPEPELDPNKPEPEPELDPNKPEPELELDPNKPELDPNKPEPEPELDPNKPEDGALDDPKVEEPPLNGDELAAAVAEFTPNSGELLAEAVDPNRLVVIPDPEVDPNRLGAGAEPEAAVEEPRPKGGAEEAEEAELPKPKDGAEAAELGLGKAMENGLEPEADDVVAVEEENEKPVDIVTGTTAARVCYFFVVQVQNSPPELECSRGQ